MTDRLTKTEIDKTAFLRYELGDFAYQINRTVGSENLGLCLIRIPVHLLRFICWLTPHTFTF